jgi:FixJ family two-component response regulator
MATGAPISPRKAVTRDCAVQDSAEIRAAPEGATVFLVDDDKDVRDSLAALISSVGFKVQTFGLAAEFLESKLPDVVSCLVLDVRLPRLGGLDFQAELAKANNFIPIIFMTGYGDIPMSVKAMKAGAVDFLIKPFRDQDMLDTVTIALERDRKRRQAERHMGNLKSHLETLTQREREVMALVTTGLMNKQVAGQLGVSEMTVKLHRGHAMQKMGALSLADLIKMADALGMRPPS